VPAVDEGVRYYCINGVEQELLLYCARKQGSVTISGSY